MNAYLNTKLNEILHQQEEVRLKLALAEHQAISSEEYWIIAEPQMEYLKKLRVFDGTAHDLLYLEGERDRKLAAAKQQVLLQRYGYR